MKQVSLAYRIFNIFNVLFFAVLSIIMLFPFVNVLTLSLLPNHIASQTGVIHLFPSEITLGEGRDM